MGKSCRSAYGTQFLGMYVSISLHGGANLGTAKDEDWLMGTRRACPVHASVYQSIGKKKIVYIHCYRAPFIFLALHILCHCSFARY